MGSIEHACDLLEDLRLIACVSRAGIVLGTTPATAATWRGGGGGWHGGGGGWHGGGGGWRGGYYGGGYYRGGYGWNDCGWGNCWGPALGLGLLGGAIIGSQYPYYASSTRIMPPATTMAMQATRGPEVEIPRPTVGTHIDHTIRRAVRS
jgi:hypothetical protein